MTGPFLLIMSVFYFSFLRYFFLIGSGSVRQIKLLGARKCSASYRIVSFRRTVPLR